MGAIQSAINQIGGSVAAAAIGVNKGIESYEEGKVAKQEAITDTEVASKQLDAKIATTQIKQMEAQKEVDEYDTTGKVARAKKTGKFVSRYDVEKAGLALSSVNSELEALQLQRSSTADRLKRLRGE